ncbi:MAG: hypothetical protein ACTSP2_00650 [Alphaproteobacteria bacterium]
MTSFALDTTNFPPTERGMLRIIPLMIAMVAMIMMGGVYVAATGIMMQGKVPVVEAQFHGLLESYYDNSKEVRDTAATGSQLNRDLAEINKFPSRLLELKLVGLGRILTGVFLLLFGILGALVMLPFRVRKVLRQVQQQT